MVRIAFTIIAVFVAVYGYLRFVGVEPQDRRPGTRLSGVAAAIPADLSTLALAPEVHLQTHPWYGIPFSVTTVIAHRDGRLYVPSLYESAQPFPGSKYWNAVVARNPQLKLRVDGKLYDFEIYPISEQDEFDRAFAALGQKYPFWAQQVAVRQSEAKYALLRLEPSGTH